MRIRKGALVSSVVASLAVRSSHGFVPRARCTSSGIGIGRCSRAFSIPSSTAARIRPDNAASFDGRLFGERGDGDNDDGGAEELAGGDELSRQFSQFIRARDGSEASSSSDGSEEGAGGGDGGQQQQQQQQTPPPSSPLGPEDEAQIRSRDAFSTRREVRMGKDASQPRRKKFTGRAAASAPPFESTGAAFTGQSGQGGSLFSPDSSSGGGANEVRSRMVQREFNLVSRASGSGQVALAIVLALSLAFYAYVGLTGGITDGSERFVEPSEFNALGEALGSSAASEGIGISSDDWSEVVPPRMEGSSVWL